MRKAFLGQKKHFWAGASHEENVVHVDQRMSVTFWDFRYFFLTKWQRTHP